MQVLVTGARGFIGRALCAHLAARGHEVIAGLHRVTPASLPAGARRAVAVDFVHDVSAGAWLPRLAGVDAVVNTVGIIRERGDATFERLHVEAPVALFEACRQRNIVRVVHLSALGADAGATSAYHRTKRAADDALLARLPQAWCAQPSLVFGAGGASARLFCLLASLPLTPLPGHGESRVQPIHVDDLVAALCALLEGDGSGGRVALVGPRPLTVREWLAILRSGLRLPPTWQLPVPWPVMRLAARAGDWLPGLLLDRATLRMLERGNASDSAATTRILGRPPRAPEAFIPAEEATAWRTAARLSWLLPLARASIALLWIATAIVSFGVFPVGQSEALLVRTGVAPALAPLLLYGAATLDLAFGVALLLLAGEPRRWLLRAQVALIVFYSAVIAWKLPEFWVHPYAPMVKNVPLVALLVLLDVLEERP